MNLVKKYFKNRNISYYIMVIVSLLTITTSALYFLYIGNLENGIYFSFFVALLPLVGVISFFICSFFDIDKVGISLLGCTSFITFILFVITIYDYIASNAMDHEVLENTPFCLIIIIIASFLLLNSIISNILIWIKVRHSGQNKYLLLKR